MQVGTEAPRAQLVQLDGVHESREPKRAETGFAVGSDQLRGEHPVYLVDEVRSQQCGRQSPTSFYEDGGQSLPGQSTKTLPQIDVTIVTDRQFEDALCSITNSRDATSACATHHPGLRIAGGFEEPRFRRNAQAPVEQHSDRSPHHPFASTRGEFGVVGECRLRTDQDRIAFGSQPMNELAGWTTRDPTRLAVRESDPSIETRRQFESHEGPPLFTDGDETAMLPAAFRIEHARPHVDARTPQATKTAPRDLGMWISRACHDPTESSFENGFGAGPCPAGEVTRLERHRDRSAPKPARTVGTTSLLDRHDLGVSAARRSRRTTPENLLASVDNGPHARIGMGSTGTAACQA